MYPTPGGDRILVGAERRLYEESLGMMTDFLASGDMEFGIPVFDQLQRGSKLYALYQSGRALLRPDEPVAERSAYLDAAIAAVYQHVLGVVEMEIEDGGFVSSPFHWRKLVFDAACESDSVEQVPNETSDDKEEWDMVIECLAEDVLWDRDFEIEKYLDADPDSASAVKNDMGIPTDYYTAVPLDPPDHQLNLYVDALMGLTPRGRGRDVPLDDLPEDSSSDPF